MIPAVDLQRKTTAFLNISGATPTRVCFTMVASSTTNIRASKATIDSCSVIKKH